MGILPLPQEIFTLGLCNLDEASLSWESLMPRRLYPEMNLCTQVREFIPREYSTLAQNH
jgi:hypothetical protein